MGQTEAMAEVAESPRLVRVLTLLAVLATAVLLTRCPIGSLHDVPVPPPTSFGGR